MIQKKPHLHAGCYTSLVFFPVVGFFLSLFLSFFFTRSNLCVVIFSFSSVPSGQLSPALFDCPPALVLCLRWPPP